MHRKMQAAVLVSSAHTSVPLKLYEACEQTSSISGAPQKHSLIPAFYMDCNVEDSWPLSPPPMTASILSLFWFGKTCGARVVLKDLTTKKVKCNKKPEVGRKCFGS